MRYLGVHVSVDREVAQKLKNMAEESGMTLSAFVEEIVLKQVPLNISINKKTGNLVSIGVTISKKTIDTLKEKINIPVKDYIAAAMEEFVWKNSQ